MKDASENSIEKHLRDEIKKRGGFCIKMDPNRTVGIPDRFCILPGSMFFVELKRGKAGRIRKTQEPMIKRLTEMGHAVHILRTKDEIDSLLKEFSSLCPQIPNQMKTSAPIIARIKCR